MKCKTCNADWGPTDDVEPEDTSWDSINTFHFNVYPDELVILTNAPEEAFKNAVRKFGECASRNIDDILHEMGYVAVCGSSQPALTITL